MQTYTTTEVAKLLRINVDAVRARIQTGELEAADISRPGTIRRKYRVTEEQLADYLRRKTTKPAPARVKPKKAAVDYLS